ncbi:MAG: 23S rRNA (guanosine(2251)-2'-O)-methyltransferase RlmB [Sporichthyaceae bacterium]|nr:23S rRNA (guanosine(2251)-2'-O)-methyltransferase RlmB [Sporichthyaceae bacterium]
MAGNSQRRGAKRKEGSKKGAVVGSGGQKSKGLRGKKPTPAAKDRTGHPAARRAAAAARVGSGQRAGAGRSGSGRSGSGPARTSGRPASSNRPWATKGSSEVVAGRNAVVEALRAGVPATHLYVAERIDSDDRVRDALKLAADLGLPLLEAPRPELDRITSGALHQGLALQVPAYPYLHPDDLLKRAAQQNQPPLIVALDSVTDPRNLGAVVRSAAAFGAHGVLVPERRAAGMTAGAWKASAGAAARVPVARAGNLTRALEAYRDAGCFVAGLAANGTIDVADLELAADPLVLVVGSEGKGLSRLVGQSCDVLMRIPMAAGTESLNAGVAAGIALYEIRRRRTG